MSIGGRILIATLGAGFALAGCGGGEDSSSAEPRVADAGGSTSADDSTARKPVGKIVKTRQSSFGTVLIDARRQTIYAFDKEKTRKSECYGDCAKAWPPVLTLGPPRARGAARPGLLG